MLLEPFGYIEGEVLFTPKHPRQGLAHHTGSVGVHAVGSDASIELIRLGSAHPNNFGKLLPERLAEFLKGPVAKPQPDCNCLPSADIDAIVSGRFRACLFGVRSSLPDRILCGR